MVAAMKEQVVAANRMIEQIKRRYEENLEGHSSRAEVDLEYLKFAKFQK